MDFSATRMGACRRLAALLLGGLAFAAGAADCRPDALVYVGSEQDGIRALRFDACAGTLAPLDGTAAAVRKPRWLLQHPTLPVLYATAEGAGSDQGLVLAYTFDERSGALAPLGQAGSGGAGPTHLAIDAAAPALLVANFGAGTVSSLALQADGRAGPLRSTLQDSGSGPHRRQAGPHAHGVALDPSGRFALVADMGADRVFVYGFDRASQQLRSTAEGGAPCAWAAPAGSGPRRAVFGADGRTVYVLGELSAQLTVLRWDGAAGCLAPLQALELSESGFQGQRSASELALGRDGRFLYVADRGAHQLLVYRVAADGTLELAQRLPSGGTGPWAFDIDASGRWLLVAHHGSNGLALLAIDPASGRLAPAGPALPVPAPFSVLFVR
ncbi:MAG: lactonase family protein [Pseudorhodoferax sp.]